MLEPRVGMLGSVPEGERSTTRRARKALWSSRPTEFPPAAVVSITAAQELPTNTPTTYTNVAT
ncbi:hypothetical protein GCM10027200_18660 [Lentzea nigeriaca]